MQQRLTVVRLYHDYLIEKQICPDNPAGRGKRELDLMRMLAAVGTPTQIGSSALGLMVWRDIDILVVSPGLRPEQALKILQPLFAHPQVLQVQYRNKGRVFNDTGRVQDERYFFAVLYQTVKRVIWNIDVSFWLHDSPRQEVTDLAKISHQLTEDARIAILWIKEIWHCLPAYHGGVGRRMVSSRDIYEAVLQYGVRTPVAFDAYLHDQQRGN